MYLRSLPNKDKYVNQLHDTLYQPEKRTAPSDAEFAAILRQADNPNRAMSFAASPQHSAAASPQFQPAAPKPYATVVPSFNSHNTAAPAPPPPRAPAAVVEDVTTEWHYIDKSGGQHGPSRGREVKECWLAGSVDGECIAWNPNLDGWSKINTIPDFLTYLNS